MANWDGGCHGKNVQNDMKEIMTSAPQVPAPYFMDGEYFVDFHNTNYKQQQHSWWPQGQLPSAILQPGKLTLLQLLFKTFDGWSTGTAISIAKKGNSTKLVLGKPGWCV